MAPYLFGRLPNDPTRPRVTLRTHPGATLTPPPTVDWYSAVPSWGMLDNDTVGDCTAAAAGHLVDQLAWYAQNKTTAPTTAAEALTMYEAISGYIPGEPSTDVGATIQSALEYMQKTGIAGYELAAFAQIDNTNLALVQNCVALFGAVCAGLNVPASAIIQFDAGKPWTVPTTHSGGKIVGGHCVPIVGFDGTYLDVVTWGTTQKVALPFYTEYFDETWIGVFPQWLETTGSTPSGLNVAAANADYQALTGSTASPFTGATPPPPGPPGPDTNPDDIALAAAEHTWLKSKGL